MTSLVIPKRITNFIERFDDTFEDGMEIIVSLLQLAYSIIDKFIKLVPELISLVDSGLELTVAGFQILNIMIVLAPALLILYYTSRFIQRIEQKK